MEELLREIRNEQIKLEEKLDKYHKINMKKFAQIREFNEINDMTNQVFEKRISNIENLLQKCVHN